jgi:hypothetical protein
MFVFNHQITERLRKWSKMHILSGRINCCKIMQPLVPKDIREALRKIRSLYE